MPRKATQRRERGGNVIRTFRLIVKDVPGQFAKIANAIARHNAVLGEVDIVRVDQGYLVRDITVYSPSETAAEAIADSISKIPGVRVGGVLNEVLEAHRGGNVTVESTRPLEFPDEFKKVGYPGMVEVCRLLAAKPELAREYSLAGRVVGVLSTGQDVLGLGDVGPAGALPFVEGIAAILSRLGPVKAFPLVIDMKEVYGFVNIAGPISPGFAGLVLGGIREPEIMKIHERLDESLPIPVFLTGLHGIAVAALAALEKALYRLGKTRETARVAVNGASEAACGMTELLKAAGYEKVIVLDSKGAIYKDREADMPEHVRRIAELTNSSKVKGRLSDVLPDRDVCLSFNGGETLKSSLIRSMKKPAIVFSLGEPSPEPGVKTAHIAGASIAADRNHITASHGLCGMVRGSVEARVEKVTLKMCLAASEKLLELSHGNRDLLPPLLDMDVHEKVALAVREAR